MENVCVESVGAEGVAEIAALAGVIWRSCYPGIISGAQIEYMLQRIYDPAVMRREIEGGVEYFRATAEGELRGFAACGPDSPGTYKLHKLYVHPDAQGQGVGRALLSRVEERARAGGAHTLILNVNKRNERAIQVYRRQGFQAIESVVVDIGGGFVMDDFVMGKGLGSGT